MKKIILLEHHPNDSRIKVKDDDICQSLTGSMGTGGGNVPLIIMINIDEKMGNTYTHEEQANTLAQRDYKQPQAVIYETTDSPGIKSKPCNDNK